MESLEHRLASLERSHHRWRAFCMVVIVLSGSAFFLCAKGNDAEHVFERIEAKQFVVVNDRGEGRGGFQWDEKSDSGFLGLLARDKPMVTIGITPEEVSLNGANLTLYNRKGKIAISASSSASGGGVVDVYDSAQRRTVTMQATNDDQGMVGTFLKNGHFGAVLGKRE